MSINLLSQLITQSDWPLFYLRWELALLEDMGFGLDLTRCAVTNKTDDLIYISPKSGRAVSRSAAGIWASKLLPFPECLITGDKFSNKELKTGFEITGYFLNSWLAPLMNGKPIPNSRKRLLGILSKDS